MTNLRQIGTAGAFIATVVVVVLGVFAAWPRPATAEKPGGCQQWEVMLSPSALAVIDASAVPEMGKPFVEKAPAGWEPFAFRPTGQLVYRRCTKQ